MFRISPIECLSVGSLQNHGFSETFVQYYSSEQGGVLEEIMFCITKVVKLKRYENGWRNEATVQGYDQPTLLGRGGHGRPRRPRVPCAGGLRFGGRLCPARRGLASPAFLACAFRGPFPRASCCLARQSRWPLRLCCPYSHPPLHALDFSAFLLVVCP